MMNISLNFTGLMSREALHDQLAQTLGFPEYYGKNLDALYDCLTSLPETLILLQNTESLQENLGRYGELTLQVFQEASEENPCLHLSFDTEPVEETTSTNPPH